MIRRLLSSLSGRTVTGLPITASENGKGALGLVSNHLRHQSANFTSLVPRITARPNPLQEFPRSCINLFLECKPLQTEQIRTVVKFSWKKGKRKTVRAVPSRFMRLHWGIWIRTCAGRFKKQWKKRQVVKNRQLNHVFCNATQSRMLDKMVNKFWRRPKYYIEDPYEPYHKRENFPITRTKPWRPEGCDYE